MDVQDLPADQRPAKGSDPHERRTPDREADPAAREASLRAREALSAERHRETQTILDDAEARDSHVDARDALAEARDRAASLHSFLNDEDVSVGLKARRSASMDKADSKDDRASAVDDRSTLSKKELRETEAAPSSE